jgi:hypothetical protein
MGAFAFRLEHEDGTARRPADAQGSCAELGPGDTINLVGRDKMLHVIEIRPARDDDEPVLVSSRSRPFALRAVCPPRRMLGR